jgi:hypothetical protein
LQPGSWGPQHASEHVVAAARAIYNRVIAHGLIDHEHHAIQLHPSIASRQGRREVAASGASLVPWRHEKPPGNREIALEQVF